MFDVAIITSIANIIGIASSLLAAFFWLWASVTYIPPFPDVGFDSYSSVFEPVRTALRSTSKRNAIAAFFAAIAALSSGVNFSLAAASSGGG